jgi:uncharacterized membrane protein YcfT
VGGRRYAWVDAARGLAILLVAFVHAEEWLRASGVDVGPWHTVNSVLVGMRMPLFFTISGTLGAGWLARSWSDTFSRKVGFLLWVYLVWQPIGLLAALMSDQFTGHRQTPGHFLLALAATSVRPRAEFWFLWALAAYFAAAWVSRRIPVVLQIVMAGVLAAVCLSDLVKIPSGWNLVPCFYVFFLMGLHLRHVLLWVTDRLVEVPRRGAVVVALWLSVATITTLLDLDGQPGLGLVTRGAGLASGIVLAVHLAGSRLLRYLGSRTLPIYLAHSTITLSLVWWVHEVREHPLIASVGPLLPLATSAISVVVSLALPVVLRRTPGRYLFEPPATVTHVLERIVSSRNAGAAAVSGGDRSSGGGDLTFGQERPSPGVSDHDRRFS